MDKFDLQILEELTKDAQTPFSRIAEKIGVSPKKVQARYNKMKEERTILRSSITVDLSKLGYQGRAFLSITNAPNRNRKETIDALKQMPNIFLLTEIIGDFDVLAIVAIKNLEGIISLVNAVRKLPSVDQAEFLFLTSNIPFPIDRGFERLFQTKKRKNLTPNQYLSRSNTF